MTIRINVKELDEFVHELQLLEGRQLRKTTSVVLNRIAKEARKLSAPATASLPLSIARRVTFEPTKGRPTVTVSFKGAATVDIPALRGYHETGRKLAVAPYQSARTPLKDRIKKDGTLKSSERPEAFFGAPGTWTYNEAMAQRTGAPRKQVEGKSITPAYRLFRLFDPINIDLAQILAQAARTKGPEFFRESLIQAFTRSSAKRWR